MTKYFFTFIISLVLVGTLLPTSLTNAQEMVPGLPFGGLVSYSTACTCSVPNLLIWFTPLYLGGPLVTTGPMAYSPFSSRLYANFRIGVPLTWHLGSYIPGVQACWMIVGTGCAPFPVYGLINKVGTN